MDFLDEKGVPLYTRVCDYCWDKMGGLVINTICVDELSPREPTNGMEDVTMVMYILRKSASEHIPRELPERLHQNFLKEIK